MLRFAALFIAAVASSAAHAQTVTVVCTEAVGRTCEKYGPAPKPGVGMGFGSGGFSALPQSAPCLQWSGPKYYKCEMRSDTPMPNPTRVTLR